MGGALEDIEDKIRDHYIKVIQTDIRQAGVQQVDFNDMGIKFSLKHHDVDIIFKIKKRK